MSNCRQPGRDARAQAESQAQAIIAQGRRMARQRLEGAPLRQALVETGVTRVRPILMTALTTILGLGTLAMGIGSGADMLQPMAVVTIGGLAYATLLTLFVVPILYDLFHRRKKGGERMPAGGEEVEL